MLARRPGALDKTEGPIARRGRYFSDSTRMNKARRVGEVPSAPGSVRRVSVGAALPLGAKQVVTRRQSAERVAPCVTVTPSFSAPSIERSLPNPPRSAAVPGFHSDDQTRLDVRRAHARLVRLDLSPYLLRSTSPVWAVLSPTRRALFIRVESEKVPQNPRRANRLPRSYPGHRWGPSAFGLRMTAKRRSAYLISTTVHQSLPVSRDRPAPRSRGASRRSGS